MAQLQQVTFRELALHRQQRRAIKQIMHDVILRFILHQESINKYEWLEACHNQRRARLGLAV